MSNNTVPAAAEGMPAIPTSLAPIEQIRRLQKELSAQLATHADGRWFAMTMPEGEPYPQRLGVWPLSTAGDELPIDKVTRLAWELSSALSEYQGGRFQAQVLPSCIGGNTVMLAVVTTPEEKA
jgi:hypothetical protein